MSTQPDIHSVTWYNNGKHIEPSDKYRLCDEGGGIFCLDVGPVEIGDDGEWKCVVKSDGGYATSTCKITLAGMPSRIIPRFKH